MVVNTKALLFLLYSAVGLHDFKDSDFFIWKQAKLIILKSSKLFFDCSNGIYLWEYLSNQACDSFLIVKATFLLSNEHILESLQKNKQGGVLEGVKTEWLMDFTGQKDRSSWEDCLSFGYGLNRCPRKCFFNEVLVTLSYLYFRIMAVHIWIHGN